MASAEADDNNNNNLTEIELPAGRLMIAFRSIHRRPMVTSIASDSPLIDKVKHGYIVTKVTLPEGSTFRDLDAQELVYVLHSTTGIPNRKLTMIMTYPSQLMLEIPYKDRYSFKIVNVEIEENDNNDNDETNNENKKIMKNKPICVANNSYNSQKIESNDSKYHQTIREGMIVFGIRYLRSGHVIACSTAEKLSKVLTDSSIQDIRIISLRHPDFPIWRAEQEFIHRPIRNDTIDQVMIGMKNDDGGGGGGEYYYNDEYDDDEEEEEEEDQIPILTLY